MKWSKSHLHTIKDAPSDAEIASHKLLIRAGMIKKVSSGIYTYAPLLFRSIKKFETIVREELDKMGCQEIFMPTVHPDSLWKESGRWQQMGVELLRFQNRNEHWFCLAGTHEECVTDFIRNDLKSYRDLPVNLYQIQDKYRDEIRPRFGLMRGREFRMNDAYSFDLDKSSAIESYHRYYKAYQRIFDRTGLRYCVVEADSGNIGGDLSNEFQVLAESGEDGLLVAGDYAANIEVCPAQDPQPAAEFSGERLDYEEFETPWVKTIADLAKLTKAAESGLVKTLFYMADDKPVAILLRGSDEFNPIKMKKALNLQGDPVPLSDKEVREICGANPGSCGPLGLKIPIHMDTGVERMANYLVGANKDGFHLKNVNHPRDYKPQTIADYRMAKAGDLAPNGKDVYESIRGIEVGHIFYLGTKYSKAMDVTVQDEKGQRQQIEMGCYGIGITRTVQAAVEQNHDKDGIMWPESIAPYLCHICLLDPDDEAARKIADDIYDQLWHSGIDVLMDDRAERPGVKFKDADLLGMPVRLVIGKRGLSNGKIEVFERKTKEKSEVETDSIVEFIKQRFGRA